MSSLLLGKLPVEHRTCFAYISKSADDLDNSFLTKKILNQIFQNFGNLFGLFLTHTYNFTNLENVECYKKDPKVQKRIGTLLNTRVIINAHIKLTVSSVRINNSLSNEASYEQKLVLNLQNRAKLFDKSPVYFETTLLTHFIRFHPEVARVVINKIPSKIEKSELNLIAEVSKGPLKEIYSTPLLTSITKKNY